MAFDYLPEKTNPHIIGNLAGCKRINDSCRNRCDQFGIFIRYEPLSFLFRDWKISPSYSNEVCARIKRKKRDHLFKWRRLFHLLNNILFVVL